MSGENIARAIGSVAGGIVTGTGRSDRVGNYVIEAGPNGWTLYHHLACVAARPGTMVVPGSRIGTTTEETR